MCTTCGCSDDAQASITNLETGETAPLHAHASHDREHAGHHHHGEDGHGHDHEHPHDPAHPHEHRHPGPVHGVVTLEQQILAKNDRLAARNRGWFEGRGVLALNLVSSPGAGKTTLLERTLADLGGATPMSVVEGDQATANDARRLRESGCPVIQVNTGSGCHLEADMLARALAELRPPMRSVLFIENVGNLVCPALFDLGEHAKVVILSVAEGEDKPIKYPHMFRAASLLVISKLDLLPHVSFDLQRCRAYAREVNPDVEIIELSATTGEGLAQWYGWVGREAARLADAAAAGPLPAGAGVAPVPGAPS